MSPAISDRDTLVNRRIPEMSLSDGSATSKTAPPEPVPRELGVQERASWRFEVKGNAVFTGGTGTLALESARALLEHGLSGLALFDVNPLHSLVGVDALRADFPLAKIIVKKVDVTNAENLSAGVAETVEELGSIDVLCCFAGVVGCAHALDMKPDEWRHVLEINTTGSFLAAQTVARQMAKQPHGGSIVFIASISGHSVNYPQPQASYNVSKAGVLHLKSCLAAEWARYGIRVNSISPGYMDTILNEGPGLDACRNIWQSRTPLGRMGQPQELTGPLVMLCSRAGSYITGADLVVDGGISIF